MSNTVVITTTIIWDGNNYIQIVNFLVRRNQEMKVRVKGKRLVIKDEQAGFYRCIPIGEHLEIPNYEERDPDPEEPDSQLELRLDQVG